MVNWAKTTFSESFPELWLLAMGGLFIGVVLHSPSGLAGLWASYVRPSGSLARPGRPSGHARPADFRPFAR